MRCKLCNLEITKYSSDFNHLELDEKSVDICEDCIEKFSKWQQNIAARLFPTTQLKKMVKRN